MQYFLNKNIWITGASSGIGKALTIALNKLDCHIFISSRREEELIKIKKQAAHPDRITVIPLDLEVPESIEKALKTFQTETDHLDILFNNGGVSQRSFARDTSLSVDRKIMEINFFGNIALTKATLPLLKKSANPHIVVTSSVAGKYGFFERTAYSASKHALHGFYESLRLEEKENGLKISILCPGPVQTSMSKSALTASGQAHGKEDRLLNQGMTAEKVARKFMKYTAKGREEVYFGGKEIIPIYIKRFIPSLFTKIMSKQKPTSQS